MKAARDGDAIQWAERILVYMGKGSGKRCGSSMVGQKEAEQEHLNSVQLELRMNAREPIYWD